jgi:nucleotide-binding universal stress UspA family protein
MYQRILVPTDGSTCCDAAVEHAIRLAEAMGSTVVFLFVMDTLRNFDEGTMPEVRRELAAQGTAVLEGAQGKAAVAGVEAAGELAEGSPADVIVQKATDFDVVVMGSHGKVLWKRLTVGSVTQSVLRRTPTPLLVVPARPAPH